MPVHNESRDLHNEETRMTAVNHGDKWREADDEYIVQNLTVEVSLDMAYTLGRTLRAVYHRHGVLRVTHLIKRGEQQAEPPTYTLQGALEEKAHQTKLLPPGAAPPTIQQVPWGWVVKPGHWAKEEHGN